nr:retrotransposon protein, putative, Ty1-copia subclass [Tanacetum cinerariifolium]
EPRTRTKPLRFRDESYIAAYVFAAAEKEDTHEPLTYQEAVACKDGSKKTHYSGSDRLCSFRLIGSVLSGIIGRFKQEAFGKFKEWKQTIKDKVRCLLIQSGLPKTFWAEVTCTVAYLINRSPSTAIEKNTHMEMWSVEVELQGLSNRTLENDHTDQEDGARGSKENSWYEDYQGSESQDSEGVTIRTPDLTDYQLVRNREPRTRTKPLRFRDESYIAAYVFAAAEKEDTHEPLTYQEAVACKDGSK